MALYSKEDFASFAKENPQTLSLMDTYPGVIFNDFLENAWNDLFDSHDFIFVKGWDIRDGGRGGRLVLKCIVNDKPKNFFLPSDGKWGETR